MTIRYRFRFLPYLTSHDLSRSPKLALFGRIFLCHLRIYVPWVKIYRNVLKSNFHKHGNELSVVFGIVLVPIETDTHLFLSYGSAVLIIGVRNTNGIRISIVSAITLFTLWNGKLNY